MKKILIGLFALALTLNVSAQNNRGKGFKKERIEQKDFQQGKPHFSRDLNLTADQRTKMQSLNETYKNELKDLKSNTSLTAVQRKERRETLMQEHKTNLEALLTPEQRQQLDQKKKDFKGMPGDKVEGMKDLQKRLNLTDAQGQKIKAVNQDFKTKTQAVQKNESLTATQKKEQMKQLQEQHTIDIKSILTEEQKSRLEDLKKNHPNRKTAK